MAFPLLFVCTCVDQHMSMTEPVTRVLSPTSDASTAVVKAVATTTDIPIDELPLLYDVIDPDALDAIVQSHADGRPRTGVHVTFTMAGCTVRIRNGAVTVTPESEPATEHPTAQPVQGN